MNTAMNSIFLRNSQLIQRAPVLWKCCLEEINIACLYSHFDVVKFKFRKFLKL
jgi:hypothetical protein